MKLVSKISVLLASSLSSVSFGYSVDDFTPKSGSAAEGFAISSRCSESQLARPQTEKLYKWLFECGHLPAASKKALTFKFDSSTGDVVERTNWNYPIFAKEDPAAPPQTWVIWQPPFEEFSVASDPALCAIPAGVAPYTLCQESCLSPNERVLFDDGYEPIANALRLRKINLMTLKKGSSLESLAFEATPIKNYVRSLRDENETLLHLFTKSGGRIRVTTNHPLVDATGKMRDALDFKLGESLLRADGVPDQIISIQKKKFFGKVYQVEPSSMKSHNNIYNAEGFLNGSANWQNETIVDFNRLVLRSSLSNLLN